MAGFKGQAEYSIDSKGRVAIPAKMRNAMNPEAKGTFTMTRGFEHCVFLYPQDRWSEMEDEFSTLSPFNREARAFMRNVLRWAEEVTLDGQGRISLSKPLSEFANLSEKALIIGALDHIEIWDPDTFDSYLNEQPEDYETLAERVMSV
jgi:MraZ protein